MNKSFLAIVVVAITVLVIGIPVSVWYAKKVILVDYAENAVKQKLIDPSSAEFRNVRPTSAWGICGEVNAKNRMGGYVGFRYFKVSIFGGQKIVCLDSDNSNIAQQLCKGE
jgi:hypothetical protein